MSFVYLNPAHTRYICKQKIRVSEIPSARSFHQRNIYEGLSTVHIKSHLIVAVTKYIEGTRVRRSLEWRQDRFYQTCLDQLQYFVRSSFRDTVSAASFSLHSTTESTPIHSIIVNGLISNPRQIRVFESCAIAVNTDTFSISHSNTLPGSWTHCETNKSILVIKLSKVTCFVCCESFPCTYKSINKMREMNMPKLEGFLLSSRSRSRQVQILLRN